MTNQTDVSLVQKLSDAKIEMINRSAQSGTEGDWDGANRWMRWAQQIDAIITGLDGNNSSAREQYTAATQPAPSNRKLPYYYVEGDRLVKVGPSRDGGSYEHRVLHDHYEMVVNAVATFTRTRTNFETNDITSRCDIPGHEPLIVLAVLEQEGLINGIRRGRWSVVNSASIVEESKRVWQKLPRQ